jgi:hypothetical protein
LGPRQAQVSDDEVIGQTDPFYAECRAYGRIAERPRKRPVAIACHGFIGIEATTEPFLEKRFKITEWGRPQEDLERPLASRPPFRALVKDLDESEPEISDSLAKAMLRDLKALHSLKIYVMDISIRNYKGGKLVDFSSSWTEPHIGFRPDLRPGFAIRQSKGDDAYEFDEMIKELGVRTSVRAMKNDEVLKTLRPRTKKVSYK